MQKFPDFSPIVPKCGENKKTVLKSSRDAFLTLCSPCSPFFQTKKNKINKNVNCILKDKYIENNRKERGTGNTHTETTAYPDQRFEDEEFRFCVHVVLEYLGLDATFGNFKKLESQFAEKLSLDWYEIARGILNPSHEARVYRLIANPRAGPVGTRCGTMIVELQGVTKEEAMKNLDTKKYEFIGWW